VEKYRNPLEFLLVTILIQESKVLLMYPVTFHLIFNHDDGMYISLRQYSYLFLFFYLKAPPGPTPPDKDVIPLCCCKINGASFKKLGSTSWCTLLHSTWFLTMMMVCIFLYDNTVTFFCSFKYNTFICVQWYKYQNI
jgi:hypothetical protein